MVLPPPPGARKVRKQLSADALYALLGQSFARIPDHRQLKPPIPLRDALLSAFAMFSLKDPSLLAFDQRRSDANLKALFGIGQIPSDTQMREILDPLAPEHLRPAFGDVFRQLQRGKALEPFEFYNGCYLLSLDGTGYFSSQQIHCASCQVKEHRERHGDLRASDARRGTRPPRFQGGDPPGAGADSETGRQHQNDCERNAARRLLQKIRREHPRLKLIVVEDGLASNGPHVRDLIACGMHFILGVKPGDHEFLFTQVEVARRRGCSPKLTRHEGNITREVSWVWDVPLNESNQDLRVNFLEYREYDAEGKCYKTFTWITDLHITHRNAWWFARGGRARWHIENETFNTLKNQGYHYEHNYGHGQENLSVVFAMLMMLAFLVDQTQQLCCGLFRAVWQKLGSKRALWEILRSHFYHFTFRSMRQLYEAMLYDLAKGVPLPTLDSS